MRESFAKPYRKLIRKKLYSKKKICKNEHKKILEKIIKSIKIPKKMIIIKIIQTTK